MNGVVDNLRLVANAQSADTQRRAGRLQLRPRVRPHRRDPGHRHPRVPDALPRPSERHRRGHQPRFPGAGMSPLGRSEGAAPRCHERAPADPGDGAQRRGHTMSIHVALNHVTHYHVRPAGGAFAAGGAPAPGAALPHADPQLLAARRAGRALHQLAAGSVLQLPGAPGLPREDHRVQGHRRPGGRDVGLQPVRLLSRAGRREVPVRLRRCAASRSWRRIWSPILRRRACKSFLATHRSQRAAHDRLPGGAEPAAAEGHPLPDPHGAGRAIARADAAAGIGLVPRHRLAAGADACATWAWPRASCRAT